MINRSATSARRVLRGRWALLAVALFAATLVAGGAFARGRATAPPSMSVMTSWKQTHRGDIAWMRNHLDDLSWVRAHPGQRHWMMGHSGHRRWMMGR